MSLFLNNIRGKQVLDVCRVVNNLVTKQCHWYPRLKPGPYPKTEEERIAAAKKYNLLPEEYEPYPDDGTGAGDYPKLPYEAVDEKDLYHNWDHVVLSRDFMDPLPRNIMQLLPYADAPSKHEATVKGSKIFLTFIGTIIASIYILSKFKVVEPLAEKQLVGQGVHYTFEIDEELVRRLAEAGKCECANLENDEQVQEEDDENA